MGPAERMGLGADHRLNGVAGDHGQVGVIDAGGAYVSGVGGKPEGHVAESPVDEAFVASLRSDQRLAVLEPVPWGEWSRLAANPCLHCSSASQRDRGDLIGRFAAVRVAALLAWHFEPDTSGRPHLVTAAATRTGVDRALEAQYLVALWLLVCVAAAIDIDLADLHLLGFRRGRKSDGYGGDYCVFDA